MWLDHSYPIYFCMSFVTGTTKSVSPDRASRRLILGVLLSIILHAMVLSLQFGIPGLGLPGMELPWSKRRAELTPELLPLAVQLQVAPPASMATAVIATPVVPEILPVQPDTAALDAEPKTIRLQTYIPKIPKPSVALAQTKPVHKKQKTKAAPQIAAKPVPVTALRVPAAPREPMETPVRIIAQEQIRDDSFVVPMPSPEDPVHKATDSKQAQQQVNQIIAESDEKNEVREAEAARLAALALAKERELALIKQDLDAQRMREAQERLLAEQLATQLAQQQAQQQAEQARQKQKAAKILAEESRQQAEENAQQVRQQAAALAMQKQVSEQIERERRKREEQQESAQREALQQERQKRLEQQTALELAMRKQAEELEHQRLDQKLRLQAATRQKQAEELLAKQQAEQLSERQRAEELARRKAAEQKLAEQKLAEQKLAEQKLAEQKLAEQKLAEQKLAEQKIAEQKLAEQKLAEQRARELALQAAAMTANKTANNAANNAANGTAGADVLSGNQVWSKDIFNSDLANRSKQQLRDMDALRAAPPVARKTEADERSRRRSILGSLEREVPLRMYVDSWRQKIERNGNLNYSQVSKDKARGDPVALVVLRSDGSVEEVTILRSSGRADLDEAVKRIVRVNAPYAAFPPNIAAKYDVIEIRRIWSFEDSLKLVEELR
jgi:TonB family protein